MNSGPPSNRRVFCSLCNAYEKQGAAPLKLRSLELWLGFYPISVGSVKKLNDLPYLKRVHLENRNYASDYEPDLAYDASGPSRSPNLRWCSVDEYTQRVHDHFCAIAEYALSFTRKLALHYGTQLPNSPEMPMLLRTSPNHPSAPSQFKGVDIHLDPIFGDPADPRNSIRGKLSAEEVLENLISTNADTLEELAIGLPGKGRVLKRGEERGPHYLRLLNSALAQHPNLTRLRIDEIRDDGGEILCKTVVAERLASKVGLASP
ncbi:hypothetical protein VTI74DRAFT_2457 [Chaetomium olivicolor]